MCVCVDFNGQNLKEKGPVRRPQLHNYHNYIFHLIKTKTHEREQPWECRALDTSVGSVGLHQGDEKVGARLSMTDANVHHQLLILSAFSVISCLRSER